MELFLVSQRQENKEVRTFIAVCYIAQNVKGILPDCIVQNVKRILPDCTKHCTGKPQGHMSAI